MGWADTFLPGASYVMRVTYCKICVAEKNMYTRCRSAEPRHYSVNILGESLSRITTLGEKVFSKLCSTQKPSKRCTSSLCKFLSKHGRFQSAVSLHIPSPPPPHQSHHNLPCLISSWNTEEMEHPKWSGCSCLPDVVGSALTKKK